MLRRVVSEKVSKLQVGDDTTEANGVFIILYDRKWQ
jgi:hypothetical protein